MRLWHSVAATSAQFDDPNLVSCAGLVPVMRLAQDCGLAEVVGERVTATGPLGANTPHKIGCVVAGMIAGADAIDDLDLVGAENRVTAPDQRFRRQPRSRACQDVCVSESVSGGIFLRC